MRCRSKVRVVRCHRAASSDVVRKRRAAGTPRCEDGLMLDMRQSGGPLGAALVPSTGRLATCIETTASAAERRIDAP